MKLIVVNALLFSVHGARISLNVKAKVMVDEINAALGTAVSVWNHEVHDLGDEEHAWTKEAEASAALIDISSMSVEERVSSDEAVFSNIGAVPSSMNPSNFTVIVAGSGHSAQVAAAMLSLRYKVYGFSLRRAESWKEKIAKAEKERPGGEKGIEIIFGEAPRKHAFGKPDDIVGDSSIVKEADIVLLAMPTLSYEEYLTAFAPYAQPGTIFVALMSHGGTDLVFRRAIRSANVSETDFTYAVSSNLPWSCRGTGTRAQIKGVKNAIKVAVTPKAANTRAIPALQSLLGVFPQITLAPNQLTLSLGVAYLIHIGIMYGRWSEESTYKWDGKPLKEKPFFYHGVDDFTESILIGLSDELQKVKNKILELYPSIDLSGVLTMKQHYEYTYGGQMRDCSRLMLCLHTCKAYETPVKSVHPMIETKDGFMPDFKSRYLAEDVPMSVTFIKGVAALKGVEVETPVLDKALTWAQSKLEMEILVGGEVKGNDLAKTSAPQGMGIDSLASLLEVSGLLSAESTQGGGKQSAGTQSHLAESNHGGGRQSAGTQSHLHGLVLLLVGTFLLKLL